MTEWEERFRTVRGVRRQLAMFDGVVTLSGGGNIEALLICAEKYMHEHRRNREARRRARARNRQREKIQKIIRRTTPKGTS